MVKDALLQLADEGKLDALEDRWLELLEQDQFDVGDLLSVAHELRHRKERDRANVLTRLLREAVEKKEDWRGLYAVLKDLARVEPLEAVRSDLRFALQKIYPVQSSASFLLRHYRYDDIASSQELLTKLKKIERWLLCEKGQIVFDPRYGAGRVRENNYNLGLVRIDFETKDDVAIEVDDPELVALPPDNLFRQKLDNPGLLSEQAEQAPAVFLGRLLQTYARPLKVTEIKQFMSGILHEDRWNSWWNTARKDRQLVVSGKGNSAQYTWGSSASEAESALKEDFERASVAQKIEIAKQAASRKNPAAESFQQELVAQARKAYADGDAVVALQILESQSKNPALTKAMEFTLEDVVGSADPVELLRKLGESRLEPVKEKVVAALPNLFPDRWLALYSQIFMKDDNPRVLRQTFDALLRENESEIESLMDRVTIQPYSFPAVITWICQTGAEETELPSAMERRLDAKFLISIFSHLDDSEFASYRTRIKTAIEKGLLINILKKPMEPETAEKAISVLDHASSIEEYRLARWKNAILGRNPELKKREDVIFTTQEALDRKRHEMDDLIHVELPANRKAVGEAAAHGDLRENAEYKAARERQEYLIVRLEKLQRDLARARLIEPGHVDCSEVRPGTSVVLRQDSGKQWNVTILGLWDSNPNEGIYSYQSGIGTSLLGKVVGERIELNGESWIVDSINPWTNSPS